MDRRHFGHVNGHTENQEQKTSIFVVIVLWKAIRIVRSMLKWLIESPSRAGRLPDNSHNELESYSYRFCITSSEYPN